MKPLPTQVWYPGKVLPWYGCYGFIPMYETEEAARAAFPYEVILTYRLLPPDIKPPEVTPKPKKRKARKGAK